MEGLTGEEARRRLTQYGKNILPEKREFTAAGILIHQFTSPLIFVLLAAVAITIALGDMVDAAVIGAAVAINTILGFVQEYKAETTLAALKNILTPQAKVIREAMITGESIPVQKISNFKYVFVCRMVDRPLRLTSLGENRWLLGAVVAGALLQLFAVYHPWGNLTFGTVPLPWSAWGIVLGASIAIVGMIEGVKRLT